jgi:hypothetical protein
LLRRIFWSKRQNITEEITNYELPSPEIVVKAKNIRTGQIYNKELETDTHTKLW